MEMHSLLSNVLQLLQIFVGQLQCHKSHKREEGQLVNSYRTDFNIILITVKSVFTYWQASNNYLAITEINEIIKTDLTLGP